MIFNLISKAKDLFINRNKTGVAADNVEDAITVLNSNLITTVEIPIDEFFSETVANITDAKIYKKGSRISGYIKCSGDITSSNSGTIKIGTLASAYVPKISRTCGTAYNPSTQGQSYKPCVAYVGVSRWFGIYIGDINTQCGNASYSWSTSDGILFDYEL